MAPRSYIRPDQKKVLELSTQDVPQFLFRTISDQSRGHNDNHSMRPANYFHDTIDQIHNAAEMIDMHIDYRYATNSEFISWSSSLLFVMIHAVRKQYMANETNVAVGILDTYKLQEDRARKVQGPMKIYPATTLCRVYNRTRYPAYYYTHEYLMHGPLVNTGCYEMVSLDALVEAGLFQNFVELYCNGGKLSLRTIDVRWEYFSVSRSNQRKRRDHKEYVSIKEFSVIKDLGKCFSDQFRFPMTMAFLTLKALPTDWKETLLPKVATKITSLVISETLTDGNWQDQYSCCEEKDLWEVTQFRDVMTEVCLYFKLEGEREVAAMKRSSRI